MDIIEQLTRDEGSHNRPYTDTVGKLTIGVGRNLTDVGLYDAEISFLLHSDIDRVTNELQTRLPWFNAIDPIRQAVLVNMAFNLGFRGLEGFPKMLQAFAQGEWETVREEMLNSQWAKQVGDRARRLALQVSSGEWV